jgi:hypothetical protein
MLQLPDLYIGSFLSSLKMRQFAARELTKIKGNFCFIKIKTSAKPPRGYTGQSVLLGTVSIEELTRLSAIERAISMWSETTTHHGWYFYIPHSKDDVRNALPNIVLHEEIAEGVRTFREKTAALEREWCRNNDAYLADIGARGRRQWHLQMVLHPEDYALGVRYFGRQKTDAEPLAAQAA